MQGRPAGRSLVRVGMCVKKGDRQRAEFSHSGDNALFCSKHKHTECRAQAGRQAGRQESERSFYF